MWRNLIDSRVLKFNLNDIFTNSSDLTFLLIVHVWLSNQVNRQSATAKTPIFVVLEFAFVKICKILVFFQNQKLRGEFYDFLDFDQIPIGGIIPFPT